MGKSLMAGAAATVKRVSLELGGNAPFIVFADAGAPPPAGRLAGWVPVGRCLSACLLMVSANASWP